MIMNSLFPTVQTEVDDIGGVQEVIKLILLRLSPFTIVVIIIFTLIL